MTRKLNNINGLQGRTTEHQLPTAVLQKWWFSASYDSFVGNQSSVLRLKFSGENRHLRKAAKRKIDETISQSLQQAETLKQSILKKAFEGKLI